MGDTLRGGLNDNSSTFTLAVVVSTTSRGRIWPFCCTFVMFCWSEAGVNELRFVKGVRFSCLLFLWQLLPFHDELVPRWHLMSCISYAFFVYREFPPSTFC